MPQREQASLTALSHGAGCACKIGAGDLAEIQTALSIPSDPALLVGLHPADDAAVYRLTSDLALVQTIDFFTPIVDDPFDYGRIAAANALSDIYAMGARPLMALNVLAFPIEDLGISVLTEILRGGSAVAAEAGIPIAGGHSIDDPEPKYGLAVSGVIDPGLIVTKAGARAGDALFLTKPIGGGLITTAAKKGLADEEIVREAVTVMAELNAVASQKARAAGASAMTDVTGFGLLGHLHEICLGSGLAAEIEAAAVPTLAGAIELSSDPRCVAGGSKRNASEAAEFTSWHRRIDPAKRILLSDAMTSGGLLIAVPPQSSSDAPGTRIGQLIEGRSGSIQLV